MRVWTTASFLIALFQTGNLQAAVKATESAQVPQLVEAFIEIRVTKTRGSSFYRVMVDEQERPYLDVVDVFERWFDMNADCQIERFYCQAVM